MISRWAAVVGALGTAGLAVAVAGAPLSTYVSESGVPGAPHAGLYAASMVLLAVSLALLATVPTLRLVAACVGLAAALAGVTAGVHCSPGCPLPPYETPAARDLVHATGAVGALGLCALAMLLCATLPAAGRFWRRAGRIGILVAYPPLILSAAGILLVGRSLFTGVAERLALAAVCAWVIFSSAAVPRTSAPPAPGSR
ncbi:DUF998 domain-containing protein [Dactylosporangium salmoneum]|uniref:DUF998 domain-containing protein n=1 Tax=Dactylosporangium salmoneum TaxID=53361 RepID=A0ABP5TZL3_9ACTN